ncbi:MAG TPA: hypothetical protein VGI39_28095 [Polyangiaceae bacterium]|jgi:hypothetical protein
MAARSVVRWGFALVLAPLAPACSASSPDASNPMESSDGAAPEAASGGGGSDDSGGATWSGDSSSSSSSSDGSSSDGPSTGDSGSTVTGKDSGGAHHDSGTSDGSVAVDGGACIRPPYQTTNECTGIGQPGGPVIPSCSQFDGNGQLLCPSIPGCTVVPDPSGTYCTGDNVTCGLSDCGHICILPNWSPCYDVATGKCLEDC